MVKCKACKTVFKKYIDLRSHFGAEHHQEYRAIKRWLEQDADPRIAYAEELIREETAVDIYMRLLGKHLWGSTHGANT